MNLKVGEIFRKHPEGLLFSEICKKMPDYDQIELRLIFSKEKVFLEG